MSQRKRYKEYIWNESCQMPGRTKRRLAQSTAAEDATGAIDASDAASSVESTLDVSSTSAVHMSSDDENLHEERRKMTPAMHSLLERAEQATTVQGHQTTPTARIPRVSTTSRALFGHPPERDDSSDESSDNDHVAPEPTEVSELEEKLYPGCPISQGESLLLVMGHSLRHHSTKEATESLLHVIEAHLPFGTVFPMSKYLFYKQFSGCKKLASLHLYCPNSLQYLGAVKDDESDVVCSDCQSHVVSELVKNGTYFIMLSIEAQCIDLLEGEKSSVVLGPKRVSLDVRDITLSKAYNELPLTPSDISITWNTDGVPVFESSKYCIWPLQLQVNELPQRERASSILLGGLWFGAQKPNMNCFLKPFVDDMNRLSSAGFTWTDPSGHTRHTHVFPGPCSVDTVARSMVMNMTQFNGTYGCGWCEHKGEVVARGRGHSRVYPVGDAVPLRTHASFEKNAKKADETDRPCRGVKGLSVLMLLAFFKFPTGFVVDYMHAVCSGFVKHTACMWFDCKSVFPYSMGGKMSAVDSRLLSLQPILEMSRLPRSLTHRSYWKSSEWRNWLLYFSPVVLRGLLPPVYYKNWVKFVHLMHFLLMDSIPVDQLQKVSKHMRLFLKEYEQLYGKEHMTYNAHLLLHLVDCVKEWGPLWNYSAFPFENMNGCLVKLVNGTRYAQWQIVDKFLILSALPKLCSRGSFFSQPSVKSLMTSLIKRYKLRKFATCMSGCVFQGKAVVSREGTSFSKVRINGILFCVARLDKSRRLNSYVEAVCDDGSPILGRIVSILTKTQEGDGSGQCEDCIFCVQELKFQSELLDLPVVARNFSCVEVTNRVVKVNAFSAKKCVALKVEESLFLCRVDHTYMFEAA